jgi:hypothetical protein
MLHYLKTPLSLAFDRVNGSRPRRDIAGADFAIVQRLRDS